MGGHVFRATRSSPPLPSRPRPSTSHPGPTGDREETRKVSRLAAPPPSRRRGARCESAASGCAALPGRCGASAALRRRTPPPAGLPGAAAGAQFINAKVLLLCFVPGIPLFIHRRASAAFSLGLRRSLPSPPPKTCSPEPTRICLGAHGLP